MCATARNPVETSSEVSRTTEYCHKSVSLKATGSACMSLASMLTAVGVSRLVMSYSSTNNVRIIITDQSRIIIIIIVTGRHHHTTLTDRTHTHARARTRIRMYLRCSSPPELRWSV